MAMNKDTSGVRQRRAAKSKTASPEPTPAPSQAKDKKPKAQAAAINGFDLDLRHALLVTVALVLRVAFINYPDQVVWDELHFAKFAGHYVTVGTTVSNRVGRTITHAAVLGALLF
jgi:dolichyl-phosphate-mannose-protein mannosyltransferase